MLLTFSRGGVLSLIVGQRSDLHDHAQAARLSARDRRWSLRWPSRLTGPQILARFRNHPRRRSRADASAQSRLDLPRDCYSVMMSNPITGIGPGTGRWSPRATAGRPGRRRTFWLEVGAEIGIPRALAMVVFFVVVVDRLAAHPAARRPVVRLHGRSFAFTGLVGFMVGAQFVTSEVTEIPFFVALVGLSASQLAGSTAASTGAEAERDGREFHAPREAGAAGPGIPPCRALSRASRWSSRSETGLASWPPVSRPSRPIRISRASAGRSSSPTTARRTTRWRSPGLVGRRIIVSKHGGPVSAPSQ